MALPFKRLDIRGLSPESANEKLAKSLKDRKVDESFWLIDDKEPLHCYKYLVQENYLFETFIISSTEYRIFIGLSYNTNYC